MASRRRRRPRRIARTKPATRAPKVTTRAPKAAPRPASSPPAPLPPVPGPPPPSPAETLLLTLARTVSTRAGEFAQAPDVTAMVEMVAAAYEPGAPLAAALRESAADKTAQLARGWAREQVRLALMEIVASAGAAQMLRTDTDADTLAWLWLAACESLAHETPAAVTDRVHALAAFLTARGR